LLIAVDGRLARLAVDHGVAQLLAQFQRRDQRLVRLLLVYGALADLALEDKFLRRVVHDEGLDGARAPEVDLVEVHLFFKLWVGYKILPRR